MLLPPAPVGTPFGSYTWADWYQKIRNVINSSLFNHNDLQNIQGGTTTQRYHLTSPQYTEATQARSTRGVDTTDDIIIDSTTKGLVLKSPNGHYWRASISNAGVVTWTDLGTTKP